MASSVVLLSCVSLLFVPLFAWHDMSGCAMTLACMRCSMGCCDVDMIWYDMLLYILMMLSRAVMRCMWCCVVMSCFIYIDVTVCDALCMLSAVACAAWRAI